MQPGAVWRGAVAAVACTLLVTGCSLRPVNLDAEQPLALRSTITAADGTVLARLFNENRTPIKLASVPKTLIDAVLAAEDARFFSHAGIDVKSMARAAIVNFDRGKIVQGGSTITQQYVKNIFFRHPVRSLERKAREIRLAIEVERIYNKRQILERYLNTVYLGEGAYGVEAASETYFGHSAMKLTVKESALVAALIQAPSAYNPRRHPHRAVDRRNYVVDRMASLGSISPERAARLKRSRLGLTRRPPRIARREPYFVEAVRQELLSDRRLGPSPDARDRLLHEGGLRVRTTLDRELQRAAEASIASTLDEPGDPEVALVALRPRTGEIVAMVGGRDWSASQVNLALGTKGGGSGRQPGSAFKTIVAAAALEGGIPLTETYESSPATFVLGGGQTWTVSNAEGQDQGELPLDEALVRSVNGVYARLALQLGGARIASQAHLMGVRSKLPPYPSIGLGATEVSVVDMAAAYATLANGGTALEPTTIAEIETPDGRISEPDQEVVEGAMSPGNAYLLTKALQQVVARGTGVQAAIGRPVAGKTGTTDDYADAWFVGYTPQLVTAVWVGYPQGRVPMTSVHGITVMGGTFPAQIFGAFMRLAHEGVPKLGFGIPRGELVTVELDPETGLLATSWCPGEMKTMLRQLVPTEYCPQPPPEPPPSPEAPTPSPTPSPTADEPGGRKDRDHPSEPPSGGAEDEGNRRREPGEKKGDPNDGKKSGKKR